MWVLHTSLPTAAVSMVPRTVESLWGGLPHIRQCWCSNYWYTTKWEGKRERVLRKQSGTQWCVAIHSWSPSYDSSISGQRWVLVHWSFTEQTSSLFTHPPITLTTSPLPCTGSLSAEKERSESPLAPTAALSLSSLDSTVGQVCVCVCVCVCVRVCVYVSVMWGLQLTVHMSVIKLWLQHTFKQVPSCVALMCAGCAHVIVEINCYMLSDINV